MFRFIPLSVAAATVLVGGAVQAADFDAQGNFVPDTSAAVFEPFDAPVRFVPEEVEMGCLAEGFEVTTGAALEGDSFVRLQVTDGCAERFQVEVPAETGSYRATVWMRHGSLNARVLVEYPDETGLATITARMAPTGRATSDGWVELATNELPVDGTKLPVVYLRVVDLASTDGVDLDALELVPAGEFYPPTPCEGVRDPVCGDEGICLAGECRLGRLSVPPLPPDELKDEVVGALAGKLQVFYGGRKTRLVDLPVALATIESMRDAETAWQFWSRFGRAGRELHDWHTRFSAPVLEAGSLGRINTCFIEGDADLTHGVWPKHPQYDDILVSHAGIDGLGLVPGDRLVAVDGEHPIVWARKLIDVDWAYQVASDSRSFADFAEALGGVGGTILRYAREITVIRCDQAAQTCADTIETIRVRDIPFVPGGPDVACDNRPYYHLGAASPSPFNHYVFGSFFHGKVDGTADEEKIFGLVFDTLYGGGNPNGNVNGQIKARIADWKANARGVILDHRAGNGGTLDAPEYLTDLVRPPEVAAVVLMPIEVSGFAGPESPDEGIQLFNETKSSSPYSVGDAGHDPNLPVALIIHRDGSASDYLPLGMKGAPKVKIFGPGPTAGAFSTFIQFAYWGGLSFQFASGDTITKDGAAMIGSGVVPDVLVDQKQSDLLAGRDTIHEAALAWVRQELKP